MTIAVSKTTFFTSGPIKFSELRSSFKEASSGSISASEVKRNTSTSASNPIVPDATENASVAISTNLKLSQFRNTIKYYTLNQSDTDLNVNISTQTWNSNLSKNIVKRMNINGTCASTTTATPALYLNALVYNLRLIVNGSVLGAGGAGGTSSSGGNGGSAISLISSGDVINVLATTGSQVYGGGGGGSKGAVGADGETGSCSYVSSYTTGTACGSCPGCGPGYSTNCYRIGGCGRKNRSSNYQSSCSITVNYASTAPAGGAGGNGGNGQGYTQTRSDGSTGVAGEFSSCGGNTTVTTTQGNTGETGGNGGDWGAVGGKTTAYAASSGGAAITGSNYAIDQDSVSASFKGAR
jgi:hypothetical protein